MQPNRTLKDASTRWACLLETNLPTFTSTSLTDNLKWSTRTVKATDTAGTTPKLGLCAFSSSMEGEVLMLGQHLAC